MNKKARVIAFYLPQFHPIPENDMWWGKGFTEWTNVGKAKPLFKGHYQPRVPADLGYYDLRLPEIRENQACMAREAGIEGFCYYHYWFDNNKQLLEKPFNEVLFTKKPDYPFMLCWANESWHAKFWNKDSKNKDKLLIEQKYGSLEEQTNHFNYLLTAFKDKRYIQIEGKPAFMVYKPLEIPREIVLLWNKLAKENGLKGIYFIGQTTDFKKAANEILSIGFNAINPVRHYDILNQKPKFIRGLRRIMNIIYSTPKVYNYSEVIKFLSSSDDYKNNVFPTILPNWDHSPRSGKNAYIITNSTPVLFEKHVEDILHSVHSKEDDKKIIFIKSWNEWGEGNYLEPDLRYGHRYLEILKKILY